MDCIKPIISDKYKQVLFISNLHYKVTRNMVLELFSQVGPVSNIFMDIARGIGYVEYTSECSVLSAMLILADACLFDQPISLSTLTGENDLRLIFLKHLELMSNLKVRPCDMGSRTSLQGYDIKEHESKFFNLYNSSDNRNQDYVPTYHQHKQEQDIRNYGSYNETQNYQYPDLKQGDNYFNCGQNYNYQNSHHNKADNTPVYHNQSFPYQYPDLKQGDNDFNCGQNYNYQNSHHNKADNTPVNYNQFFSTRRHNPYGNRRNKYRYKHSDEINYSSRYNM